MLNQQSSSSSQSQSPSVVVDFAYIKEVTGDDQEFIIEILDMILEQSPDVVAEMYTCLEMHEFVALSSTAHKYKSSINILGNKVLNDLLRRLENTAKSDADYEQLKSCVVEFEQVWNDLSIQLSEELTQLKSQQ